MILFEFRQTDVPDHVYGFLVFAREVTEGIDDRFELHKVLRFQRTFFVDLME